jgi:hypothetical protein
MERRHAESRHSWIGGVLGLLLLAAPTWATSVVAGTPWSGSQDQGGATAAPGDTNRVDFVFDPSKSELTTPCEEIVLIQVAQICPNGIPVDPGTYHDGYEYRDDDAIDDQPDTSGDETGTFLDHVKGDTTPYYQDTGGGSVGSSNGHSTNSTTADAPSTSGGNRGFPSLTSVTMKFETCAFCRKGEDAGHYFGCITWEYTKTAGDQAAGTPGTSTFTGTSNQPSSGFTAAVDQWAANNDFDLP